MKSSGIKKIVPALIIISGYALLYAYPGGKSILKKCDGNIAFKSSYSEEKMIITTTGGEKRTLLSRSWSLKNGRETLTEYLSPSDIRGQKMLMRKYGDDIWMYNAETRRTRKLGSHMRKRKMMGSDFSYEDSSGRLPSEKFQGKVIREENFDGADCYVMDLEPTKYGPGYGRIVSWISKEDFTMRRGDYYRKGEKAPFKRLVMSDFRRSGGRLTAHRMLMKNLEDQTETEFVIGKIRYGVNIPKSLFSPRNMER